MILRRQRRQESLTVWTTNSKYLNERNAQSMCCTALEKWKKPSAEEEYSKFKSNKSCCVEKFVNLFELNLKNLFSIQILFLLKESLIDLF